MAIGIENVWNRFLLSPLETARFLDEIGSPWVGMYLDVGNVVYLGYPEQWVELLAKHIKKLHMSDYRFGGHRRFCRPVRRRCGFPGSGKGYCRHRL